jgi:hypothetical protein
MLLLSLTHPTPNPRLAFASDAKRLSIAGLHARQTNRFPA